MFKVRLIAVGSLKKGPEFDLYHMYAKRLKCSFQLIEIKDGKDFSKHITPKDYVIACDEHGDMPTTMDLYHDVMNHSPTFLIGDADGFPDNLSTHKKIALGRMTWPHLLVRSLLVEQIYRCQQIFLNHPYHRA
jgi:23S rRNA (pseudouridine1915-N3)-methyltransferase